MHGRTRHDDQPHDEYGTCTPQRNLIYRESSDRTLVLLEVNTGGVATKLEDGATITFGASSRSFVVSSRSRAEMEAAAAAEEEARAAPPQAFKRLCALQIVTTCGENGETSGSATFLGPPEVVSTRRNPHHNWISADISDRLLVIIRSGSLRWCWIPRRRCGRACPRSFSGSSMSSADRRRTRVCLSTAAGWRARRRTAWTRRSRCETC